MIYSQAIEEAGQYGLNIIKQSIAPDHIYMMSQFEGELSLVASLHQDENFTLESQYFHAVTSLCSLVVQSKKSLILSTSDNNIEPARIVWMTRQGIGTFIGAPIFIEERLLGVIGVVSESKAQYEHKHIKLLEEITAMIAYAAKLKVAAMTDGLTGLYNRSYIEYCNQQWIVQDTKPYISLMYIDIDNFKTINDRYGHTTGDAVLQNLSERFKRMIGSGDAIIRMGGDEFIIIMETFEQEDEKRMLALAETMQQHMHQPIQTAQGAITVSLSMGISCGSLKHISISELIKEADYAMYGVKQKEKGAYKLSACQVLG